MKNTRSWVRVCLLAAAGRLKLPTANKNLGLGTGEIDQAAGLEFAKELNQDLTHRPTLSHELGLSVGLSRRF